MFRGKSGLDDRQVTSARGKVAVHDVAQSKPRNMGTGTFLSGILSIDIK